MKRKYVTENLLADIKELFTSNPETALSLINVIDTLQLTHKLHPEVKQIITMLSTEGFLTKQNNRFIYLNKAKMKKQPELNSSKLIEGVFDATSLARNFSYAFVRTEEGDFYVSSEDILNAFHGDIVSIEPHYRRGKPDYCYIRKIIRRASETFAGDLQQSGGKFYFICNNPKVHQWFDVKDTLQAESGMKVMLQVLNWGNRTLSKPPIGKVIEVLGKSGNPETELLAVIRQNNLPLEFPEHLTAEIETLPESLDEKSLQNRKDYRSLLTFTIDPSSAKDYDDAISLTKNSSGWTLYVHIADVAHYIKPDSALFAECVNRGNSYYFPRKVIPMLPEKLSNRICSLRQNEDKLTMSVVTEFDHKANVRKQYLWESVTNSNARLSYEQVDDLFDGKPNDIDPEVASALLTARELSALLTGKRLKEGYLFFDLPEIEYVYDEMGFVHQMNQSVETESHKLIENFMLIANQYVAERLTALAPVTLYRVHEIPDKEKLEKLATLLSAYGIGMNFQRNLNFTLQNLLTSFPDEIYHRVFDRLVLRSLKKAKYTVNHLPHFGLAIDTYTHFTSPIRRLCDLVIHHLCKKYILHSTDYVLNRRQLITYATVASEKELLADESEREVERVMNRIFMKEHLGEAFEGIIVGMNSSSIFIQLDKLPITGVLKVTQLPKGKWNYLDTSQRYQNARSGDFYQLMDKVKVQVMQVTDDVYFELVKEADTHVHHVSPLTPVRTHKNKHQAGSGKKHNKKRKSRN
jgi:ribonuclease R